MLVQREELVDYIDDNLLKQKIIDEQDKEITAEEYLQKYVVQELPGATMIMRDGKKVDTIEFVERIIPFLMYHKNVNFREFLTSITKANNGKIQLGNEEKNKEDILEYIKDDLLVGNFVMSSGEQINKRDYIANIFSDHIPENGKFILKNGKEILASEYINNILDTRKIELYLENIDKLLQEETLANNGYIRINKEAKKKKKFDLAKVVKRLKITASEIEEFRNNINCTISQ